VAHFHVVVVAVEHGREAATVALPALTEDSAIDLARTLILSGGAKFAMVMPSDRFTNPDRMVHVFLDRRPRLPEPERGRFELDHRFSW
jgi:hypothetical protein